MDSYNNYPESSNSDSWFGEVRENFIQNVVVKTYMYMLAVLTVSGLFAYVTYSTGKALEMVQNRSFYAFLIAEIIIVIAGTSCMKRNLVVPSALLLVAYSIINGMTLSIIFLAYEMTSIIGVFFITAALFGAMAFYGHTTKKDLSALGSIMLMALMGLILVTIANVFFLKSSGLDLVLAYVGVGIFIGLTAYDAQKIKTMAAERHDLSPYTIAMYGALQLYLDFVNLLLRLLRILGKRR
ncbi:MAG: Bax inhibitor-1/YccA family protein [Oscillospiraceae bacterium]|jgi:hypothetical protein